MDQQSNADDYSTNRETQLVARRDSRQKEVADAHGSQRIIFGAGFLLVMAAVLWAVYHRSVLSAFAGVLGACFLIVAWSIRENERSGKEEIEDIDTELDLLRIDPLQQQRRAEKLLRINQTQLRRYYDQNLSQNRTVFGVGLLCIMLGAVVICTTRTS